MADSSSLSENVEDIIDLDRYPINKPHQAQYAEMINTAREALDTTQYCSFPGFLNQVAKRTAVDQVQGVIGNGFRNISYRNCYLERRKDARLADDHPKNLFFDAAYTMLAACVLPADFVLKRLYNWPPMIEFVAAVTRSEKLYTSADSFQPVNVLCAGNGDTSAWHFDSCNAFTLTLMLQAPDRGGDFEIAPNIRSSQNQNYNDVRKVLMGERNRVRTVSRQVGELVIFRGSTALHRVTTVYGETQRLMGVFVYESRPGVIGDPEVNATVYGAK